MYPAMMTKNDYRSISCEWADLRAQLMMHWERVNGHELDAAGPNPSRLASLIHQRHGVAPELFKAYLRNIAKNIGVNKQVLLPVKVNSL